MYRKHTRKEDKRTFEAAVVLSAASWRFP